MKDLLLDQRVSKMWKECIDKSTKLQKALFFVADGGPVPEVQGGEFSKEGVFLVCFQNRAIRRRGQRSFMATASAQDVDRLDMQAREIDARRFNLKDTRVNPLHCWSSNSALTSWHGTSRLVEQMCLLGLQYFETKRRGDAWSCVSRRYHRSDRQRGRSWPRLGRCTQVLRSRRVGIEYR